MFTPQAKRRRMNEASKTLHKPFKSPFRTPLKHASPSSEPPSSDPPETQSQEAGFVIQPAAIPATPAPAKQLNATLPRPRSLMPTPGRSAAKKTSLSVTHELIQLRADIQILEQAHTLATSTKDEDLSRLIDTWRTATRAVAEELFASTRDRVNGMGGVAAWRDREKEQKEWRTKWDREEMESAREKAAANNEGADDREVETYDERDVEGHEEEQEEKTSGKDDDSFTMDMMLKTLNIDLKLIGYDQEAQRWDG